jgi:hypothetical protein
VCRKSPFFFVSNVVGSAGREPGTTATTYHSGRVLSRLDKETTRGHQVHICSLRKPVIRSNQYSHLGKEFGRIE